MILEDLGCECGYLGQIRAYEGIFLNFFWKLAFGFSVFVVIKGFFRGFVGFIVFIFAILRLL